MTQLHDNTESIKGKHLTKDERAQIAILKRENYSNRQIAERLGRAPQTIHNEINRGTVKQMRRQKQNGKTYDYYHTVYDPDYAHEAYMENRRHCGRRPKWSLSDAFVDWADTQMLDHHWSPDAVIGAAKQRDLFPAALMPCTTTLYNWIDRQIMRTKNMDLAEKLHRNTKSNRRKAPAHKRKLGPSISERPEAVNTRETFGHWEIDTVIGAEPELQKVEDYSVRVNHPYEFGTFDLYQSSYDNSQMKSITFQLEDSNGNTVGDRFTVMLDDLESTYDIGEGMAVKVRAYAPDFLEIDENGALISQTPTPVNPAFVFEVTDDASSELSLLQIMLSTDITQDNEYSVKFVENENHWATVLTLKKDLTLPIIATGFVIFLVGLFIGSYINHRRIWINDENGFSIGAHTNKNYFGLKKEINPVLEENGYDEIFDRDARDFDKGVIIGEEK